jgi:hypothetical protein
MAAYWPTNRSMTHVKGATSVAAAAAAAISAAAACVLTAAAVVRIFTVSDVKADVQHAMQHGYRELTVGGARGRVPSLAVE